MWKVQLFKLNYDDRESAAVQEVLDSRWITMGEKTKLFEANFSAYLGGGSRSTAVSNGTAALHMSLLALGIGSGDEVIIPSLTFVADINVVKMVGAQPVLADCSSLTDWNMSPADIKEKITPQTKAVLIVHYAGYPCDMDRITALCKEYNLYLIEDCAHAIGASYRGQQCGTFGDVACFSFFTNKNLSVGEGGMFVTRSEDVDRLGRYFRSHGMSTLTLDRHEGRAITYDVAQPGLNYRIDEMRAALGVVQLDKLTSANAQRKVLVQEYLSELSGVPDLTIPFMELGEVESSYHIFPVLLPVWADRIKVIGLLKDDGIQSSIHYPSLSEFTGYCQENLGPAPVAMEISRRELTLPLYPTMSISEVQLVCNSLKKALRN